MRKNVMKINIKWIYTFTFIFYLIKQLLIVHVSWNVNEQIISNYNTICSYLLYLFLGCLFISEVIVTKEYGYYFVIVPSILIISFISFRVTLDQDIFLSLIMIVLSRNIAIKYIINKYFQFILIALILVVLLSFVNVTKNIQVDFGYGLGHSFGFQNPNNLGTVVVSLLLSWLYLHSNLKLIFIFAIFYGFGGLLLYLTSARTAVYTILITPWLLLIFRALKNKSMGLYFWGVSVGFIFLIGFTFFLINKYKFVPWMNLNSFHARFKFADEFYKLYGLHVWGTRLIFISSQEAMLTHQASMILDSSYARILIFNGMIMSVLYLVLIFISIYRGYKYKNKMLLLIILLFLIEGFMEQFSLYAEYNFALLATFSSINKLDFLRKIGEEE